jgi:hypothetical protein
MERSAKHLFRHLHDVSALRKNPIARSYCQMGLQHLHAAVRTAAEQCRDDELRDGHDERAARQYSIVALHCLERRALREVASRLGVSVRQCYRDRAEICGRIAAILSRREAGISEMVPRVDAPSGTATASPAMQGFSPESFRPSEPAFQSLPIQERLTGRRRRCGTPNGSGPLLRRTNGNHQSRKRRWHFCGGSWHT